MAKGSNDLNILLKTKVIKLKAELDVKGSLPKIKQQIDEISKKLENKPVKLKVKLDAQLKDLRPQIEAITKKLENTKVKLKVKLDTQAKDLKPQIQAINKMLESSPIKLKVKLEAKLNDLRKQVNEITKQLDSKNIKLNASFNTKLSDLNKQINNAIKKLEIKPIKLKAELDIKGLSGDVKKQIQNIQKSTQGTGKIQGAIGQVYVQQLREVERMMKETYGKGLFRSIEFKDAEGNLRGFIAQLEKANGIIQKIRYQWNNEVGAFLPINQETVNNIEKTINKAKQSLMSLYAEIARLNDGMAKEGLFKYYEELEKRAEHGTLTQNAVRDLQRRIKEEQVLQQQIKNENDLLLQQKKLIYDIKKQSQKAKDSFQIEQFRNLLEKANNVADIDGIRNLRFELNTIVDAVKRQKQYEDEIIKVNKERLKLLRELRKLEQQIPMQGKAELKQYIGDTRQYVNSIKSLKQIEEAYNRLNKIKFDKWQTDVNLKFNGMLKKIEDTMKRLVDIGKITQNEFTRNMQQMADRSKTSLRDLERHYESLTRKLKEAQQEQKRIAQQTKTIFEGNTLDAQNFMSVVKQGDIDRVKQFFSRLYQGQVETIKTKDTVDKLGRAVTEFTIKMESSGKTARTYTLQMEKLTGALRQVEQGLTFNANRNLGFFEQLRIAMERVPTWMSAMTAYYGTIRAVQAMVDQILQVDKQLTELKRVASDDIDIDRVFQDAVNLSKELGNNITDVMDAVNDLARTFGNFNEQQLKAVAETVILMSNVSDLKPAEAMETLVGTMNAFNITAKESIHIVDALNEVDNNYSVSTKQLAEGLSKSASTAKTFGVTLEENIGHITAITAVTQESGNVVGNALKTIYSRITTLDDADEVLRSIGISIRDLNGDVRPVNDILGDLASKWGTLTDKQRQQVAVTIAGRNQLSRFLALMNNWDTAVQATTTALTSQGSAFRENSRYLDSFEARINKLKTTFTEMSLSVGEAFLSDSVLATIGLLQKLAEAAAFVAKEFGVLPVVFGAVSVALMKMGFAKNFRMDLAEGFRMAAEEAKRVKQEVGGMKGAFQSFSTFATTSVTMVGTQLSTLKNGLRAFKVELASLAASTIVGGIFVLLGIGIEKLIKHFQRVKQEAEELRKQQEKMYKSFVDIGGTEGLNQLIAEYQQLHNIKNRTIEQEQRYQKILSDIKNKFPTLIKHIDAQGNAHLKSADALKREVEYIEKMAKAQAELKIAEFNDKLGKQVAKWGELTDKIAKAQAKLRELKQWQETGMPITDGFTGMTQFVKVDTLAEQKQKELEILALENERAVVIDKIADLIYDQAMAYAEVKGYAKDLDDAQQQAIRNFIEAQKTGIITMIENMEKQKKSQEEIQAAIQNTSMKIATQSQDIARVFSESFRNMTDGLDGNVNKIREVKDALNAVAMTLDEDFFKSKSAEEAAQDIQKLIDVSYEMRTNAGQNIDYYVAKLESMGMSHDQAVQAAGELAKANQNLTLYQQAVAQGFEESANAADEYSQAVLNAVDATQEFLGGTEVTQDMSAFISNLELIKGYQNIYKDAAKDKWEYVQAVEQVSKYIGLETQVIEQNAGKFLFLTDIMSNVTMEHDNLGNVMVKINNLSAEQKQRLTELGLSEQQVINAIKEKGDWLSALIYLLGLENQALGENAAKNQESANAAQQSANARQQSANAARQEASAVNELKVKYQELKNNMNQTTRAAYFDTIKQQLNELDGKILVTKDKTGQLKLAMADGSTSPFLNELNKQLEDLGVKIVLVRDDAGKLKLALSDGQGMTTLTTINEQAKDAKVQLDETVQKIDVINQKKVMPNDLSGINFKKLAAGIDDVFGKVQLLADALSKLEGNLKAVSSVERALQTLKAKAEEVRNALKNMLSGGKTDIGSLIKKVTDAKNKIESLRNAINKLNKTKIALKITDVETIQENINKIKNSINSLPKAVTKVPSAFRSMTSQTNSAIRKIESLLKSHKSTLNKLASEYKKTGSSVAKAFSSMASAVKSRTSVMISSHNSQRSAINKLASAANDARRAIANLNSAARAAMSTLNAYIAKAKAARAVGSSIPKVPTASASSYVAMTNQEVGQTQVGQGLVSNVSALTNTFTASAGESTGVAGGGMGTSGIIRQPQSTYLGAVDMFGNYFAALASKEELPELYTYDPDERKMTVYEGIIRQLETRMQRIAKNTVAYRDALKQVIYYQTLNLQLAQKELKETQQRNEAINKRLKQLANTKKHTKAQREEYNKLQQEYDQNLSKIASLQSEIESLQNSVAERSKEIFTDFIDEIVRKYDDAINAIKSKIDNAGFKIEILQLTQPDNVKDLINANIEKAKLLQQQQANAINKVNALQSQYNSAVKKYGANSEQAKKVKEELDRAQEEYEQITLEIVRTEKEIRDIRTQVADDSINQLKEYYKSMKDMAMDAIENEKELLKRAHDEKMKMYDEEIDRINKVYDEKLKQYEKQRDEEEYQEKLAEKNQQRAELMNKIAILSRNNTAESRKKIEELRKQLDDLNKEIADMQKERQDQLFKEQVEAQKQAQIDAINQQKQLEDDNYNKQVEELDKKKDQISQYYDNIINNEQKWAQMREEAIKGSFTTLTNELNNMKTNLDNLHKGIFDSLTLGLQQLTEQTKQHLQETYNMILNNLTYDSQDVIDKAKQAASANTYKDTNGQQQVKVNPLPTPNQTTPPKTSTSTKTPSNNNTTKQQPSSSSNSGVQYYTIKKGDTFWDLENRFGLPHGTLQKLNPNVNPNKLQVGQRIIISKGSSSSSGSSKGSSSSSSNQRKTTSAVNMRSTPAYGNNIITVIPKDAIVEYLGVEKGWAKIKYKGKIGYVGQDYLKRFNTGGYTGDWIGNVGKLAILDKKELVLNEKQTEHILDTAKIVDKISKFLPNMIPNTDIIKSLVANKAVNIQNNYELTVNINKLNGTKDDANFVVKEIVKGLKKMGK